MTETILSVIAAFVLLALAFAVLLAKKAPVHSPLAAVALILAGIEIVDLVALGVATGYYTVFLRIALVLESFLPATLLWYSFSFARLEPVRAFSGRGAALVAVAVLFPGIALIAPLQSVFNSVDVQTKALVLGSIGYWFYLGVMLFCIAALTNIEGTFSSTPRNDRWKIKFEVIGVGSILVVHIFHFSHGLLYRTINADQLPVKSAVLIIGAGLVLAAKLFRENGVRVAVSRSIIYRSATLVAVGGYFIILGLVGEGMKYLEVPLGRYLTIFLAFTGGIVLLIALLSERLRRWLKVFISKHFFAHKHDYRSTWLDLMRRLASCRTLPDMEKAVPEAYREIFGLQTATLYLPGSRSGKYHRAGEPAARGFTPSPALLSYFRDRNRVWNPSDGEYLPNDVERLFAAASQARVVVPLLCNQQVEGLVIFGNPLTNEPFTYEDYDLMKIIARQSALLLSNLRLSEELMEARELAAMARVSSFVVHDLKNLTHALSLMMDNAEEHIGDAEFQRDMMITIRHTLENMKKLTQKLKGLPGKGGPGGECGDIRLLSESIIRDFAKTRPGATIVCRGASVPGAVDAEELRKVIINLVQNGLDATGDRGTITLESGLKNGRAYLKVSDTGCGMTGAFIEGQLFRPFRSTKKTGLGIGLYQCRQIVESFGGTIEVESEPGKGSTFMIELPVPDRALTLVA